MIDRRVKERAAEVFDTNASWYKNNLTTNDIIRLARYEDVSEWLYNIRSVVTDIYINDIMVDAMTRGYTLKVETWDSRCVRGYLIDDKGEELKGDYYSWSYEWLAPPQQIVAWEVVI